MRYSDDMQSWLIDAKELWKLLIEQKKENMKLCHPYPVNMGINQAIGLLNSLPAVVPEEEKREQLIVEHILSATEFVKAHLIIGDSEFLRGYVAALNALRDLINEATNTENEKEN